MAMARKSTMMRREAMIMVMRIRMGTVMVTEMVKEMVVITKTKFMMTS